MNNTIKSYAEKISELLNKENDQETKIEIDSKGMRIISYYQLIPEQPSEKYLIQKRVRGGVKDLKEMLGMGDTFTYDFLLRFKQELDVQQGGFVNYPVSQGGKYSFDLQSMAKWIHKNEKRIFEK